MYRQAAGQTGQLAALHTHALTQTHTDRGTGSVKVSEKWAGREGGKMVIITGRRQPERQTDG